VLRELERFALREPVPLEVREPVRPELPEALRLELGEPVLLELRLVDRLLPLLPLRVRAALRAVALRFAAFWLRVRAAFRAAVVRSVVSTRFSNCSSAERRSSTVERNTFGTCPLPSIFAAACDAARAARFRNPCARRWSYRSLSTFLAIVIPRSKAFSPSKYPWRTLTEPRRRRLELYTRAPAFGRHRWGRLVPASVAPRQRGRQRRG
jgi:hypothetical protein